MVSGVTEGARSNPFHEIERLHKLQQVLKVASVALIALAALAGAILLSVLVAPAFAALIIPVVIGSAVLTVVMIQGPSGRHQEVHPGPGLLSSVEEAENQLNEPSFKENYTSKVASFYPDLKKLENSILFIPSTLALQLSQAITQIKKLDALIQEQYIKGIDIDLNAIQEHREMILLLESLHQDVQVASRNQYLEEPVIAALDQFKIVIESFIKSEL